MKYLREIMIVSMILFLLYILDIKENIVGSDTAGSGNSDNSDNERESTIINKESEDDAIKNLNESYAFNVTNPNPNDSIIGLIYPEFPVDILKFKYLKSDEENTTIEYKGISHVINSSGDPKISNPKLSESSSNDIDAWLSEENEKDSKTVLKIEDSNNVIQDGIDLTYVSGCTELVTSGNGTGKCYHKKKITDCHTEDNCVWDIVCEQPHRPHNEENKIYTPQECIDRGGIIRTDILHAIQNKKDAEITMSLNMDVSPTDQGAISQNKKYIYSILNTKDFTDTVNRTFTFMDHGKNPGSNCAAVPYLYDDGNNYTSYLDPTCQPSAINIDMSKISDFLSGDSGDTYVKKIDKGLMRKNNRYNKASDIDKWTEHFKYDNQTCLWSSRREYDTYSKCTKNIYQRPSSIDWNYYNDLKTETYPPNKNISDIYENDSILDTLKLFKNGIYSFFNSPYTSIFSKENEHIWEKNMKCSEWISNPSNSCTIKEENRDKIISDFRNVNFECCEGLKLQLNYINKTLKELFEKISHTWNSQTIHSDDFLIYTDDNFVYKIKTNDINKIINEQEIIKSNGEIFNFIIEINGIDLSQKVHSDPAREIVLDCGDNYNTNTNFNYNFSLILNNNSLKLRVNSSIDQENIQEELSLGNFKLDDNSNNISLDVDFNKILEDLSILFNKDNSKLSFVNIIQKILTLRTIDINNILFPNKNSEQTKLSLKEGSVTILEFTNELSDKLCNYDMDINGEYTSSRGPLDILAFSPLFRNNIRNNKLILMKMYDVCNSEKPRGGYTAKILLKRIKEFLQIYKNINDSDEENIIQCLFDPFTSNDINSFAKVLKDLFDFSKINTVNLFTDNFRDNTDNNVIFKSYKISIMWDVNT